MTTMLDVLSKYRISGQYIDIVANDCDWENCQIIAVGDDFIEFESESLRHILPLVNLTYIAEKEM